MSRIGATPKTTVIFYGDKNNWWACYAYWVFQLFGHTNAKIMDGGRLKWSKEGRPMTREVPAITPTKYKAKERKDGPIRAFRPQVLVHAKAKGQLVDVRSPEEFAGTRLHMADYPNEGAVRGGHIPGAKSIPWARAINPDDGIVQGRGGADRALRQDEQAQEEQADDRLLPHRRAQQPHVVRAQVPARLQERQELRRVLDGVGQFGRGSRSRNEQAARRARSRSRCFPIRRTARICCSTTRRSSRTFPRRSPRGRFQRIISCPTASRRPTRGPSRRMTAR